jgi:hypothetical protein
LTDYERGLDAIQRFLDEMDGPAGTTIKTCEADGLVRDLFMLGPTKSAELD